jgi:hypothetical protein
MSFEPVTVAVNCWEAPAAMVAACGARDTAIGVDGEGGVGGGGCAAAVTVTTLEPLRAGYATLVATT